MIDVRTRRILAALQDEAGLAVQRERLVEIVVSDGLPARAGDQFGVGRAR